MKSVRKLLVPVLVSLVVFGCAASGKKKADSKAQETDRMTAMLEQIDKNAASIRESQADIQALSQRLTSLENKVNTGMTDQVASVQELKENIAFYKDQIQRLDNSIRTRRPAARPAAPSAFKPGGFDASASYKGALDEYYARRYESAISGFTELLTVAPTHDLADNSQYWIGECYYAMGNFNKALESFNKVFDFSKSNKFADAHYKIAQTQLKLGNTDAAKEEFRAVISTYPGTSAANYATENLRKLGE